MLTNGMIEWIADKLVETSKQRNAESQLAEYEKQLKETNKQIQNILRAVEMGIISDTFKDRIAELEDEKKELTGLIAVEKATTVVIDKAEAIAYLEGIRNGDCEDKKFQWEIIRDFVRAVYLYDDHFKLSIEFTGEKTVYDCLFKKTEDGSAPDNTSSVRLGHEVLHHFYLKRTTGDESRVELSETGFVLIWYFTKLNS